MRPGQQNNKRMRGRNRKGPNPLTRSYESNGPDVKVRGTALHIAEKYVQLARDAQSSGDRVAAESYLQHAEHYYRIIAAAQAAMPQSQQPNFYRNDEGDDDGEGEGDEHPFGQQRPQNGYPQFRQPNDGQQHFNGNGNGNGYGGQHNDGEGGDERPYQGDERQPQQFQPQHAPQPQRAPQPQQVQPQPSQQPSQGADPNGGEFQGLPAGTGGQNGEFRNRRRRSNRRGRRGEGGTFGDEQRAEGGGQPAGEFQVEE